MILYGPKKCYVCSPLEVILAMHRMNRLFFSGVLMVMVLGGCAKPAYIPNTRIIDTPVNREVLEVVDKYRRAMERLEAAEVLTLVHPTYQDNSGTSEGDDDVDYDGIKDLLATRFKKTTKIRYRIEYQEVVVKGRQAHVDAYIDATFVYDEPSANPRWRRLTDHNRFQLIKDGKHWRFVSGL